MKKFLHDRFIQKEKAAYFQSHLDKVKESKHQQSLLKLTIEYLKRPKMPGHHCKAEFMSDYKNNPDADLLLRRQRREYAQQGFTHIPKRDPARAVIEVKKTWAEVIQEESSARDKYIPKRYSNYMGDQ